MLALLDGLNTLANLILSFISLVIAHPITSAVIAFFVWFTISGLLLAVKDVSYQLWSLIFRVIGWFFNAITSLMIKGIGKVFTFCFLILRKKATHP